MRHEPEEVTYPLRRYDGKEIDETRVRRLLFLASQPRWHKPFYSYYCALIAEGLVAWTVGFAHLTKKGEKELRRLQKKT